MKKTFIYIKIMVAFYHGSLLIILSWMLLGSSGLEINGSFHFVMSWDEKSDSQLHEMWSDDLLFHTEAEGHSYSSGRRKRAANTDDYVRHGPDCVKRQEQLASASLDGRVKRGSAVHVVVMTEEKEQARMTCHYCNGHELAGKPQTKTELDAEREQRIWYKLARKRSGKHYKIKEVKLDMHDDPSQNRVFVTGSHTLVVEDANSDDAGTYFCMDSSNDLEFMKKMSEENIQEFLKPNSSLKFLYHLDVIKPSNMKALLVTPMDKATLLEIDKKRKTKLADLPRPAPPKGFPEHNAIVTTIWQDWSGCSVCGKPGTRRRMGDCYVQKQEQSKPAVPWYLEILLASYVQGVPCLSSVFDEHKSLLSAVSRPNEVEEEECEVSCTNYSVTVDDLIVGTGQKRIKESNFKEREGDTVTMKCPQSPVDMPVAWINGSRVLVGPWLQDETAGRVLIHANNSLVITSLLPADGGHYACVYGGRIRGRIRLEVRAKKKLSKTFRYAYYLLLTYPADFVLFLVLLYVRHKERDKVLNYDLLPVLDYDSEDEEEEEDGEGEFVVQGKETPEGDDE